MSLIELTQWIGAIGVGLFYPMQNWRAFASRNPAGLSFLGFSFILVGILGYLLLGIHLGTPVFAFMNFSNFIFTTSLLVLMWKYSAVLSPTERNAGICVMLGGALMLLLIHAFFFETAATVSGVVGLVGIVLFYPIQNSKLFLTKDPTGLSFAAFLALYMGAGSLTIFGALIQDMSVIIGNGFSALGTLFVLLGILRWKDRAKQCIDIQPW